MPTRSAVIIARCLGTEGYSDFVHNQIEKYWKSTVMDVRREKALASTERKFSKLVEELDLSDAEKKVLGRFISLRSQMSFDAGLRIGLTAHAHANDRPIFLHGDDKAMLAAGRG